MNLKTWLKAVRGRATDLAAHVGVVQGAITQWAETGATPHARHDDIHQFTGGEVGYLDQLSPANRAQVIRRHKFIGAEIDRLKRVKK
jgi:hypothetical protein